MKHTYFFILLAFAMLSISCEDLLIKDYELEDDFYEPKIVINSTIEASADTLWISVTENFSLNTEYNESLKLISEAEINISVGGQDLTVFTTPEQLRFYNYFVPNMQSIDMIGETFNLSVAKEGFVTINANTTVPKQAEVSNITYEKDVIQTPFGDKNDQLRFTIDDDGDIEDFYLFRLSSIYRDTFFNGSDTIIEEYTNYATLIDQTQGGSITIGNNSFEVVNTDQTFNGQEYQFNFEVESYFQENEKIYLEVTKLSKEAYLFLTSYNNYRSSSDFGFFSEPVTLYTNIENGFGRFEARTQQLIEIN